MKSIGVIERTELNQLFPHKVCINLDRRPEKMARMVQRFNEHQIEDVIRFSAVDGKELAVPRNWKPSPEAYGCLQSHLEVVRMARANHWPSVLIVEDDVVFDEAFNEKFSEGYPHLPSDWDMISFGCSHQEKPSPVAPCIVKLSKSWSTYACIMKHTVYDTFLAINSCSTHELDLNNELLQQSFNCYCFMPHLAWVEAGYSDIQGRYANHWYLKDSRVGIGEEKARALSNKSVHILAFRNGDAEGRTLRKLMFLLNDLTVDFDAVVVVEHDASASIDPNALPRNCRYIFIEEDAPFDKGKCFNAGFRSMQSEREYFIFSTAEYMHSTVHLLLNLDRMNEFDFISLYEEAILLDEEETHDLMELGQQKNDAQFLRVRFSNSCEGPCLFTKEGFLNAGGWKEGDRLSDLKLAKKSSQTLHTLNSPGSATKLNYASS